MAIPDFQTLMLPLLRACADGNEHTKQDVVPALAKEFGLSEEDLSVLLPTGRQGKFDNRVGWAKSHLKQAGMLEITGRGVFRITPLGRKTLANAPAKIDIRFLDQFEGYKAFRTGSGKKEPALPADITAQESTPEELLEAGYKELRTSLTVELVDLLVRMGYGGTREDAGHVLGKSGDGGIDGIINEDRLGLDVIYLQAKRWENDVGRPEIQKFVGALAGHNANKGVFLTTSNYTKEARDYASKVSSKVVLIDGAMLADLMVDYGLGVATVTSYEIKRIDSDYFAED